MLFRSAKFPSKVVQEALDQGYAVRLPGPSLWIEGTDTASITFRTGSVRPLRVDIPVVNPNPGIVAVLVSGGKETILKYAVPAGDAISVSLTDGAVVKLKDNRKEFSDTRSHWAAESIDFVTARELFSGKTSAAFAPDSTMTRGMLMTVLARLDGTDTSGGSTAYAKGIAWAAAQGISDGRNPDVWITREQIAAMLYRYAGEPGGGGTLPFSDASSISGYAREAVSWAVERGILTGYQNGSLAPQRTATRAQVAAMITRYICQVDG